MTKLIKKERLLDSQKNLWIRFVNVDSEKYVLCSPVDKEKITTPIGDVRNIKSNNFHRRRGEQWHKNWYHEWDYQGVKYCTGKPFKELHDTTICKDHPRFKGCCDDPILVFHYGKVYYASCYSVGGERFMLFDPRDYKFCRWTTHKNLQPIYVADNKINAL